MSNRAGYSPELMKSLGKCEHCGGSPSYPMLVEAAEPGRSAICAEDFHLKTFSNALYGMGIVMMLAFILGTVLGWFLWR